MMEMYNEDYYERGLETGRSFYQNYRWIPELTIPLAMTLVDHLSITREDRILDFGCAKGYLVKALRLLHRRAWGVDISKYALSKVPEEVREYCHPTTWLRSIHIPFTLCIAKDVFEHLNEDQLDLALSCIRSKRLFAVIPLGKDEIFVAPANNLDSTHVMCKDHEWWIRKFEQKGWELQSFTFKIQGIKDGYYEGYPEGHGFFEVHRKTI